MRFTKMQGAGNDFVVLNNLEEHIPAELFPELARRVCARRLSVGADGLMIVDAPRADGDFRMIFFNDDGSEGEMCGNGARCVTRYGLDHGLCAGGVARVETISGVVTGRRGEDGLFTVRLNDPTLVRHDCAVPTELGEARCTYVELGFPGHPHAVWLLPGWRSVPEDALRRACREARHFAGFPKGANVTVCEVTGEDQVEARTFERGVEDFTLACGTGCGATATALTLLGLVSGENVRIAVPGGTLRVSLTRRGDRITDLMLTGPAVTVAEGELTDPAVLELLK